MLKWICIELRLSSKFSKIDCSRKQMNYKNIKKIFCKFYYLKMIMLFEYSSYSLQNSRFFIFQKVSNLFEYIYLAQLWIVILSTMSLILARLYLFLQFICFKTRLYNSYHFFCSIQLWRIWRYTETLNSFHFHEIQSFLTFIYRNITHIISCFPFLFFSHKLFFQISYMNQVKLFNSIDQFDVKTPSIFSFEMPRIKLIVHG